MNTARYNNLLREVKNAHIRAVVEEMKKKMAIGKRKECYEYLEQNHPEKVLDHDEIVKQCQRYRRKKNKEQERIQKATSWMKIPGINS